MHALNKHDTAILVFALSSQAECRRKKLANSNALFSALSEHSLGMVAKTGLPYFHYTEKEQEGDSFGERFTNAIQAIFDKGFKRIITIGNDTPQLKTSHILEAARLLENNRLVLGPSADGGFYLMGLHQENFNPENFKALPWQTSGLVSRFLASFPVGNHEIVQLDRLFDIDTYWDITLLSKFSNQLTPFIKKIILALVNSNAVIYPDTLPFKEQSKYRIHQNKGSPMRAMA